MKRFECPIWIYAIRDARGQFVYVGQSCNPQRRFYLIGRRVGECELVILRKVDESQACRIEGQVIRALKRRGQAALNKRTHPSKIGRDSIPVKHDDVVYPSWAALARTNGRAVQTVKLKLFLEPPKPTTKPWLTAAGQKGGLASSKIKVQASRNNGKLGGRPKKISAQ